MPETLQQLRHRLTPPHPPGVVRFTSIALLSPTLADFGQEGPGSTAEVSLGFLPQPPACVIARFFNEGTGELVTDLWADFAVISDSDIRCMIKIPELLPTGPLCLVLEGQWKSGVAGCELNLQC